MLKKASDTLVSLWKGRVIATLGRVGRWTLLVIVLCLALIGSSISHEARPFATSEVWP
jgi:hypothetical protein